MKKRNINLDFIRTIAILLVIICHATEIIYSFNADNWLFKYNLSSWAQISTFSRIFMIIMFTIGRLGVPLFLFITGSLIISKNIDSDEDVLGFYKRNLLPLFIVNLIWIAIYNIVFIISKDTQYLTMDYIVKELVLLKQVPVANMWYFPVIIGIYLVLPFISKIFKSFSKKSINIVLIVMYIYMFVVPMINVLFGIIKYNDHLDPVLNTNIFGGFYGVYILLGYIVYANKDKYKKSCVYAIGIISFVITCLFQIYSYYQGYGYNVWYNFPFLLISSICLFKLLLNANTDKMSNKTKELLTFTSKTSLGVFFVHIIILHFIAPLIVLLNISNSFKVILVFLITTIFSYLIVTVLSKNKYISKYVLLIKE